MYGREGGREGGKYRTRDNGICRYERKGGSYIFWGRQHVFGRKCLARVYVNQN